MFQKVSCAGVGAVDLGLNLIAAKVHSVQMRLQDREFLESGTLVSMLSGHARKVKQGAYIVDF